MFYHPHLAKNCPADEETAERCDNQEYSITKDVFDDVMDDPDIFAFGQECIL